MLVFQNILYMNLLWLIIPLVLLMFYSRKKKEQALSLFTGGMKSNENSLQMKGYKIASWLMILSIFFLIVAIGRPAWNKETRIIEKKGHDVVFLIDVSRSMMADDLIPNRLERAKLAVMDSVNSLDGDRVALVAFAGSAVVKTPLTNDYSFFVSAVENLRIESVTKGGSLIGDALRYAIDNVLDESSKAGKDIILITDGEDQDSFPVEAAREADQQGIRIITIGLGNENEGRRIPVQTEKGKEFLKFNGEEIWTKLDAQVLRDIAGATEGGQYLNVSTGTFDLAEIYRTLKGRHQEVEYEEDEVTVYEERFQLFLFISIIFAFLSFFQPFRGFKYLIHRDDPNKMKISLLLFSFLLISPLSATGQSEGSGEFNQALQHYNNEEFDESLSLLENYSPVTGDRDLNRLRLLSANTYQMAKRSGDVQDFSNALNQINRSIGYLTRILELEGSEERDKNNLEIALKYKEVLENQESSSQDSNQNNQSVEDELNDLANEQENLAQDSNKSSEEHQQSQQNLNNRTEELSNKSNQDSSDFKDEMEKAREAQNKASEAMSDGRFEEAGQHQQEAANHLQRAQARLSEQDNENQENSSEDMSDQLIQSILDNERDSSPEDQLNQGSGIAVERNW